MPVYAVTKANAWLQVEAASKHGNVSTCIRPGMDNWAAAKATWDGYAGEDNPDVIYFIVYATERVLDEASYVTIGYVRLHKASYQCHIPTIWVIDYVKPRLPEIVKQVAEQVAGAVLVRESDLEEHLCNLDWRKQAAMHPRNLEYPHHLKSSDERDYLIVPINP